MKVRDTNHAPTFMICVRDKSATLSGTCRGLFRRPVHCNELHSIKETQTGLSRTCHAVCRNHLDMSRWFVFATFLICVHDFPRGEVSVKVGVMEFGLIAARQAGTRFTYPGGMEG